MRLQARRPRAIVDDPENDGRKAYARASMAAFDRLGPKTRQAIRETRFDAPAPDVLRRYGGPFADDDAVARRVRADDDRHSGMFGPRYPAGI